jgi:hypothetical protein
VAKSAPRSSKQCLPPSPPSTPVQGFQVVRIGNNPHPAAAADLHSSFRLGRASHRRHTDQRLIVFCLRACRDPANLILTFSLGRRRKAEQAPLVSHLAIPERLAPEAVSEPLFAFNKRVGQNFDRQRSNLIIFSEKLAMDLNGSLAFRVLGQVFLSCSAR